MLFEYVRCAWLRILGTIVVDIALFLEVSVKYFNVGHILRAVQLQ